MLIQNVMFPDRVCDATEMFFRGSFLHTNLQKDLIIMKCGESFSTDSYFNAFDLNVWKKYTRIGEIALNLDISGKYVFTFCYASKKGDSSVIEEFSSVGNLQYIIPKKLEKEVVFFRITALSDVVFRRGYYSSHSNKKEIFFAINMCTYNRKQQLLNNVLLLKDSLFFSSDSDYWGKMKIHIVNNGMPLNDLQQNEFIVLHENDNRGGGTGGFTRGIEEIEKDRGIYPVTHVIFMDDDIEFQLESFYRLYAFLSLLKEEYEQCVIAGKMFRADDAKIQYTAVEKWNKGDIVHVGYNLDMTDRENSLSINTNTGEYGGWWFCSFPSIYVFQNKPFPFFLHCDDVEYGLRFQGETITLRGVQVWHETYEYRLNDDVVYYDVRNSMVVNALTGQMKNKDEFMRYWKKRLDQIYREKNDVRKFIYIIALWHFSRGPEYFLYGGMRPAYIPKVTAYVKYMKWMFPIWRRIVEKKVLTNYSKIRKKYETCIDRYYKNLRLE